MQHNKYSGRITVILVVLFISLFGLGPLWPGGIFPFDRLFNGEIPWSKKANLKPGIDIKGGISLLYEVQAPAGGAREGLAADVAESLKKRVDPDGVKNLVWRPQGATKIEIQMPMGENTSTNAQVRRQFASSQNELAATNIQRPAIESALNLQGPARQQRLDELAMGSPRRKEIFAKLIPLHDRWKDLST